MIIIIFLYNFSYLFYKYVFLCYFLFGLICLCSNNNNTYYNIVSIVIIIITLQVTYVLLVQLHEPSNYYWAEQKC